MIELRVCIDVDDLDRAIDFYTRALELKLGRRRGTQWAELLGGTSPIDLLPKPAGTTPVPGRGAARSYSSARPPATSARPDMPTTQRRNPLSRAGCSCR